jgi:Fur family transcriptional regulator, iron response regulator
MAMYSDSPSGSRSTAEEERAAEVVWRLHKSGIRITEPRRRIAEMLLGFPQHRSAEQITDALRQGGIRVSRATVYNTLHLFAAQGLVRELAVDARRSWFDSNTRAHHHFHDVASGKLADVAPGQVQFSRLPETPEGMEVEGIDVVIRLRPKA